jgi:predicted transposase YbfD/YdcC
MSVIGSGLNGAATGRSARPRRSTGGKKRHSKPRRGSRRCEPKPAKPLPQYCFDGKARKGCQSEQTGRDEIDVTMYCPETKQVLNKRTLDDKEGERSAVMDMLAGRDRQIQRGIVSGDAGIVSPEITAAIVRAGHGYVLQIKGNSGYAFDEAQRLPWSDAKVHVDFDVGHGREETRTTRAITTDVVVFGELAKYQAIGVVVSVERSTRKTSTGEVTHETSFYVGSTTFAGFDLATQGRYVRDHWAQESFHWIKDVVLKEDHSMQRRSNGARVLATIRNIVTHVGRIACQSTKAFIDDFTADPRAMALEL